MAPLSLAVPPRPAALCACSRPLAALSAAPRGLSRSWGAHWRRQAGTSSGGGADEEQLTAGQVYERHAGYVAGKSAKRLAGRLLFLQHHGLLHLLVEEKEGGLSALQAFTAQLEASPAWQELQAAAQAERARLVALLPQDLRQAAEQRQKAALLAGEGEEEE
ncbi:hypothetical protein ABPG75_003659 [Micractinium tetrahymenae]